MHWESCTCACTNASIILQVKDEFKSNSVTRAYVGWWSKVHHKDLGMASGTNSSCLHIDAPIEGFSMVLTQLAPFDCASAASLQDGPAALAPQCPCLSFHHSDASKEVGDKVNSYEDELILRQRQQVLNK
ncbi:hypothetical protein PS1_038239 [Malus domestica]